MAFDAFLKIDGRGISLSAGKYKMVYSQQKRADGGLAGNISGGWDLTTNQVYA